MKTEFADPGDYGCNFVGMDRSHYDFGYYWIIPLAPQTFLAGYSPMLEFAKPRTLYFDPGGFSSVLLRPS